MMKRALPLVIGAAVALTLTACDSASTSNTGAGSAAAAASIPAPARVAETCKGHNGTLKVGLVTINLQALFFNQINTAAQKVAKAAASICRSSVATTIPSPRPTRSTT
jgi:ribose transport system substrate-binding protein